MSQSDTGSSINYSRVALMVGVPVVLVGAAGYYMWKSSSIDSKQRHKRILTPAEEATKFKEIGNEHFRRGRITEAVEFYNKAIERGSNDICKAKDMATFYQNRAAAHEKSEDYQSVIVDCTKALKLDKKYVKALVRRAKAFEKLDNYSDAIVDATAANIVVRFQDEEYLMLLDRLLRVSSHRKAQETMAAKQAKATESGDGDDVAQDNQGESADTEAPKPNSLTAEEIQTKWSNMLEDMQKGGNIDEAEKSLQREAEADSSSGVPHLLMGMFELQIRSDPLKAIECLKRAVEIDPNCKLALEALGSLYIQLGNIDDGITIIESSLRLAQTEIEYAQIYSMLDSARAQVRAFENLGLTMSEGLSSLGLGDPQSSQ